MNGKTILGRIVSKHAYPHQGRKAEVLSVSTRRHEGFFPRASGQRRDGAQYSHLRTFGEHVDERNANDLAVTVRDREAIQ